jgi:hypothetical protein
MSNPPFGSRGVLVCASSPGQVVLIDFPVVKRLVGNPVVTIPLPRAGVARAILRVQGMAGALIHRYHHDHQQNLILQRYPASIQFVPLSLSALYYGV